MAIATLDLDKVMKMLLKLSLLILSLSSLAHGQNLGGLSLNSICVKDSKIIKIDTEIGQSGVSGKSTIAIYSMPYDIRKKPSSEQLRLVFTMGSFEKLIATSILNIKVREVNDFGNSGDQKEFELSLFTKGSWFPFQIPMNYGGFYLSEFKSLYGTDYRLVELKLNLPNVFGQISEADCF